MTAGVAAIKEDEPALRILGHGLFFYYFFLLLKRGYHSLLKIILRRGRIVYSGFMD